jgi:hypothetical protein
MGRKFQYTSLDRVLSKIYRDLGVEEISETDVIEWTGEAMDFMESHSLLEEAVAFIEIKNHQAELPNGLNTIIQIARNHNYKPKEEEICPANVVLDCETHEIEGCYAEQCNTNPEGLENYPVPLDCKGRPLTDVDLAYYRPYFDLQYEYYGWSNSNYYGKNYTPVRLANHTFFNSLVCPEEGHLYHSCIDEYTIVGDKIRTSFKEGSIAISYTRKIVDPETGYPMVPDDTSFTTAIMWYIGWKYNARLWMMGREGYADKMQYSQQQWNWYCKQASNKAFTLHGIDEHQNLLEERLNMMPRQNLYYGFFGKLGRPESKDWKDPNKRNFRLRGI